MGAGGGGGGRHQGEGRAAPRAPPGLSEPPSSSGRRGLGDGDGGRRVVVSKGVTGRQRGLSSARTAGADGAAGILPRSPGPPAFSHPALVVAMIFVTPLAAGAAASRVAVCPGSRSLVPAPPAARGIGAHRSRGPWGALQPLCQPRVTYGHFAILQVGRIGGSAPLCFRAARGLGQPVGLA